jgi:hypothetical protein
VGGIFATRVDKTKVRVTTRKETVFPLEGDRIFDQTPRKETGTQVVNIRVNCGSKKRNPVSRSPERAQGLVRRRGLVTKPLLRTILAGGRSVGQTKPLLRTRFFRRNYKIVQTISRKNDSKTDYFYSISRGG